MQNAFMPDGAPPAQPQPQGQPMGGAQPPAQPSPDDIHAARGHIGAVLDGLIALVSRPKGKLTQKNVFDAAADMIGAGAFPTPEGRQALIARLASLPEDEAGLRKTLGQMLLQVAGTHSAFLQRHGEQ